MRSSHSVPSRRTLAVLPLLLRMLLLLSPALLMAVLLSGCTDGAINQTGQTPVSSSSPSSVGSASARSQLPGAVGTSPSVDYPGPASSAVPTVDVPAAVASAQARELLSNGPTPTPVPTIDPSIPTSTPAPTSTPRPISTAFPPAPPLTNTVPDPHQAGVQYFPQTGHTLQGVFLDYWNKHGGLSQFGYPITEEFVEADGQDNKPLQVQYFERNRFEQHPENAGTPNEVQFGLLGTETATKKGYFAGVYPRYGHAADFSWISGSMQYYGPPNCMSAWCGCSVIRFEGRKPQGTEPLDSDHLMQLEGSTWRDYERDYYRNEFTFFTVFGHLARPGEERSHCYVFPDIQIYIVDAVQMNTLP